MCDGNSVVIGVGLVAGVDFVDAVDVVVVLVGLQEFLGDGGH